METYTWCPDFFSVMLNQLGENAWSLYPRYFLLLDRTFYLYYKSVVWFYQFCGGLNINIQKMAQQKILQQILARVQTEKRNPQEEKDIKNAKFCLLKVGIQCKGIQFPLCKTICFFSIFASSHCASLNSVVHLWNHRGFFYSHIIIM